MKTFSLLFYVQFTLFPECKIAVNRRAEVTCWYGALIKVWEDVWVPGEGLLSRPNPLSVNDADLQVTDIIDFEMVGGILNLLTKIFQRI